MLRFFNVLLTFLTLVIIIDFTVIQNINENIQKDGYFDPRYKLSSYKIRPKIKSEENQRTESFTGFFGKKTKKPKVKKAEYLYFFESNLANVSKENSITFLENINSQFVEQVCSLINQGMSLRFEVQDKVLIIRISELTFPFDFWLLKEPIKVDKISGSSIDLNNLSYKQPLPPDKKSLTPFESLIVYLDMYINYTPINTSIKTVQSLARLLDYNIFDLVLCYRNKKMVVLYENNPLLYLNLDIKELEDFFSQLITRFPVLTRILPHFKSSTLIIKYLKSIVYGITYCETGVSNFSIECNDLDEADKYVKENTKKAFNLVDQGKMVFELDFEGVDMFIENMCEYLDNLNIESHKYTIR